MKTPDMPSPKPLPLLPPRSIAPTTAWPAMLLRPNGRSFRTGTLVLLTMVFLAAASVLVLLLNTDIRRAYLFDGPSKSSDDVPSTLPAEYHTIAPFVLDSVLGLLKQWPNSYAPNGHSIVAGTVPPATVLYHAKHSPGPPKKPTFFAFDAEMSIGIYGGSGQSNLHVYSTSRALNVIYFDGQAATLSALGTLDSQMAVLQSHVPLYPEYDLVYDEDQRALDLCDLVADLGIDGVVRMDAGFEVLICDYSISKVQEVFVTNNTVPGSLEDAPEGLPRDPNRQPPKGFGNVFSEQGSWEWLRSASWHYGHDGDGGASESRVSLDICRMISFYDPELGSLAGSHHGGLVGNYSFENGWGLRKGHRLLDIQPVDVERVRLWLRDITRSSSGGAACSGVNWHALFTTVRAQHGTRAREIGAAFAWKSGTESKAAAIVTKVHELSHAILAPYLEYVVGDAKSSMTPKDQTISRCARANTAAINPKYLGRSEMLLYHSLKIVMEKLCSWEWDLLEWSEKRTTDFWSEQNGEPADLDRLREEIGQYAQLTKDTLAWIGWESWTKCDRQCEVNEICAIPTWPVVYAPGLPQGGIYVANPPKLSEEEMLEFWRPKCINRTDFDRGGGRGREPLHQMPDVPPY